MARIVLVNDGNLMPIKRLIIKLCETSDIKDDKILIKDIKECVDYISCNIIVLNTTNPGLYLTKAMDRMADGGAVILNSDEKNISGLRLHKPVKLITYGLNLKSTVTVSSIDMNERISLQCCIQRSFEDLSGNLLEPQEFQVSSRDISLSVHDVLAAVTVSLLCGASVKDFAVWPALLSGSIGDISSDC